MKLYEINAQITELINQLDVDAETGEIVVNANEIFDQLGQLQMERKSILEYLAKGILNIRAEMSELKKEETRLKERRIRLECKEKRIISILDRECGGVTTDCGVATVSYRKSTKTNITDNNAVITWLEDNNHSECIRYADPEINKLEIKKFLNLGLKIPGVELVQDYSCSLR